MYIEVGQSTPIPFIEPKRRDAIHEGARVAGLRFRTRVNNLAPRVGDPGLQPFAEPASYPYFKGMENGIGVPQSAGNLARVRVQNRRPATQVPS